MTWWSDGPLLIFIMAILVVGCLLVPVAMLVAENRRQARRYDAYYRSGKRSAKRGGKKLRRSGR